jgi:hypothetical protein
MTTEGCEALEALGRTRLSRNFFMRDFLYSETASQYGVRNFPDHPGAAIAAATQLCTQILEPLQETFGRVHVRSAFRSERVNQVCVDRGLNCAPNDQARGNHIWDSPDQRGARGAMACVVLPWLIDQCDTATPPTRRRVSISSKRSAAPPPCISQPPAAAPRSRPWCGRWSFMPSDRRFPATFRSTRLPRHSSACSRVVTSARS